MFVSIVIEDCEKGANHVVFFLSKGCWSAWEKEKYGYDCIGLVLFSYPHAQWDFERRGWGIYMVCLLFWFGLRGAWERDMEDGSSF